MKKKPFKKFLATLGLIGLGIGAFGVGVGVPKLAIDAIEATHESVGEDLPLLHAGVHLSDGEHKVIFTDQFYVELMKETSYEDQYIAVNSIKKAFENLSDLNSKIDFKLYTTNEGLTSYGIPKIDSYSTKKDIPLYIKDGIIDGNRLTLGKTDWSYSFFTYELKDESITFKKDVLFTTWSNEDKDMTEGEFDYSNCVAYTIAAHEAMHAMGFAHVDDRESLLYPTISLLSGCKDFSEKDKKYIDLYNVEFYGATPRYTDYSDVVKNPEAKLAASNPHKHEEDEETL